MDTIYPLPTPDETTYLSVRDLVYSLCHAHRKRWGGDWEELVAEAHLHCVKALRSHDPAKGKLTTRVYWCVKYGLLEWTRTNCRRDRDRVRLGERAWAILPTKAGPGECVTERLTGDAGPAADALLEVERGRPKERLGSAAALLAKLGWSAGRILEAYDEILDAIT